MEKTEVKIQLFGAFRDLDATGFVKVNVAFPISVTDLKHEVSVALTHYDLTKIDFNSLLQSSALATESQVLTDHDIIPSAQGLALLPPVCGG